MNPASAMYKIIYARNARNPLYYTLPSKLCNTWILISEYELRLYALFPGRKFIINYKLKILSPFNLTSFLCNSKIEILSI